MGKVIAMEKMLAVIPFEDYEKAEMLMQSGEWCKPKYDDMKHAFIFIRRKEKMKE